MSQSEHDWGLFYSPRNGRISIEACNKCGVARGMVKSEHLCNGASDSKKESRLRGWTNVARNTIAFSSMPSA